MDFFKHVVALAALSMTADAAFAAGDISQAGMKMAMPQGMGMSASPIAAANTDALTRGTVKKIDADQNKITIQHEALENLGMPATTMVFRADDAKVLQSAEVGQSVSFRAERLNGALVVTRLQVR